MNSVRHEMVEIVSANAAFEVERTRIEELIRLVELARATGIPYTVSR